MTRLVVRSYDDADRAAVLAIFDSNLPEYFGPGEREWLEESLEELDGPAFVATVDSQPAAFGGYEIWENYNKALLFWGMAARAHHGHGLGKLMLYARLLHMAEHAEPRSRWATVDTSPMISPFFERNGFELTAVWPEGYRSGMTMHELRFDLAGTTPEALRAQRDGAFAAAEAKLAEATGAA